jgi:hypothetical protein
MGSRQASHSMDLTELPDLPDLPAGSLCTAAIVIPVLTVTDTIVTPPSVAEAGDTLQVELAGAPEQVITTAPTIFVAELSSNGKTAFWPVAIVRLELPFEASVKSIPAPLSVNVCGEVRALSVTERVPILGPPVEGLKLTCIEHVPPTATTPPQPLLPVMMEKSPVVATEERVRGKPPLFVSVAVCVAELNPTPIEPNAIERKGESDTPGGAMPVPFRATVWVRN